MGQILDLCPICHLFPKDCKCTIISNSPSIPRNTGKSESMVILENAINQVQKNPKFSNYSMDQMMSLAGSLAIMDAIAISAIRSK